MSTRTRTVSVLVAPHVDVALQLPEAGLTPEQWAVFDAVLAAMRPGLTDQGGAV